ncbi:MAG: hypothetical protein AAGM84_18325 [Pseudomonadota bacterium]
MKRFALNAALLGALMAPAPLAVLAQDKTGTNTQPTAAADTAGSAVSKVALAQDLYAHAQEGRDAIAALAAAQIMLSIDAKDVEREKETRDNTETAAATGGADAADTPATAEAMLAAATEFAGGDPSITGLIEDVKAEGSRGRIGGASRTLSRLPGGKVDVFKVPFYGGRVAELGIVGDGDSNLDLVVQDENGNTICIDRTRSDRIYCSFTPRWDGYFVVAVANMGRVRNSYYILTN